jgi:hypothetical protein
MTTRLTVIWSGLFVLSSTFLVTHAVQESRLRAAFAPVRAAAGSDSEFVAMATAHVNERQRAFAKGPRAKESPESLTYRLPLTLLDGGGGCSQRATLLIGVLDAHRIPARRLLIGLTDDYAYHVVVEAFVRGKWRVLDPLFGYVFPLDNGELATADDLRDNPDLITRVVQADTNPFPMRYRLGIYEYSAVTRFNWFKLNVTKQLRLQLGPVADAWSLPSMWERPWALLSLITALLLVPVTWLYRRRYAVVARERAATLGRAAWQGPTH